MFHKLNSPVTLLHKDPAKLGTQSDEDKVHISTERIRYLYLQSGISQRVFLGVFGSLLAARIRSPIAAEKPSSVLLETVEKL
jgi:hypothetical protein